MIYIPFLPIKFKSEYYTTIPYIHDTQHPLYLYLSCCFGARVRSFFSVWFLRHPFLFTVDSYELLLLHHHSLFSSSFIFMDARSSLSLSLSVYIRYVCCVNVLNCASNGFGFIVGCHVKQWIVVVKNLYHWEILMGNGDDSGCFFPLTSLQIG